MTVIDVHDETGIIEDEQRDLVRSLLQSAADREGLMNETEISLTFVDNERIQMLNRTYRDVDRPTDVLSFALEEGEREPDAGEGGPPQMLGDIVISVPKAKEQAAEYNHSLMRELGFLAVHGFLHLCAYDHMTKEDEQNMFSRQREILENYGLTQ